MPLLHLWFTVRILDVTHWVVAYQPFLLLEKNCATISTLHHSSFLVVFNNHSFSPCSRFPSYVFARGFFGYGRLHLLFQLKNSISFFLLYHGTQQASLIISTIAPLWSNYHRKILHLRINFIQVFLGLVSSALAFLPGVSQNFYGGSVRLCG